MKRFLTWGLAVVGGVLLGGCLFVRAPEEVGPALVVGNVLGGVGQEVEIPLEVVGFPAPGVGGVVVRELRYDPAVLHLTGIEGRNGFVLLCSCLDGAAGRARFALVNPGAGVTAGTVGVLRGVRVGPGAPQLALDPAALQVVDGANVSIPGTEFTVRLGGAPLYWVRR